MNAFPEFGTKPGDRLHAILPVSVSYASISQVATRFRLPVTNREEFLFLNRIQLSMRPPEFGWILHESGSHILRFNCDVLMCDAVLQELKPQERWIEDAFFFTVVGQKVTQVEPQQLRLFVERLPDCFDITWVKDQQYLLDVFHLEACTSYLLEVKDIRQVVNNYKKIWQQQAYIAGVEPETQYWETILPLCRDLKDRMDRKKLAAVPLTPQARLELLKTLPTNK